VLIEERPDAAFVEAVLHGRPAIDDVDALAQRAGARMEHQEQGEPRVEQLCGRTQVEYHLTDACAVRRAQDAVHEPKRGDIQPLTEPEHEGAVAGARCRRRAITWGRG